MSERPTDDHPPRSPEELAAASMEFARQQLGPASAKVLAEAATQTIVLSKIRNGISLEDATLAEVHRMARLDRQVANEFLAYFLHDLMRLGSSMITPGLRRYLDTGDLVDSVVGDIWSDIEKTHFQTKGQFLSYLVNRLKWKSSKNLRVLHAAKRREDKRSPFSPESMAGDLPAPSPGTQVSDEEDKDRLILALFRLPERDRKMLTLHLKGTALEEMAREMDLSKDTARVALSRAMRRARSLL